MQWNLVDSNFEMVTHFSNRIKLRKSCKNIMLSDPNQIKDVYRFEKMDCGLVKITVKENYGDPRFPGLKMYINIFNEPITIDFDKYQNVLVVLDKKEKLTVKRLTVSPIKLVIVYDA